MGYLRTQTLVFDKRPSFEEIVSEFEKFKNYTLEVKPFDCGIVLLDTKSQESISIYYTDPKTMRSYEIKQEEWDYEYLYLKTVTGAELSTFGETALSILYSLGGRDFEG